MVGKADICLILQIDAVCEVIDDDDIDVTNGSTKVSNAED